MSRIKSPDNSLKHNHIKALIGVCRKYLEPKTDWAIFTPDVREVLSYLQAWHQHISEDKHANAQESLKRSRS